MLPSTVVRMIGADFFRAQSPPSVIAAKWLAEGLGRLASAGECAVAIDTSNDRLVTCVLPYHPATKKAGVQREIERALDTFAAPIFNICGRNLKVRVAWSNSAPSLYVRVRKCFRKNNWRDNVSING